MRARRAIGTAILAVCLVAGLSAKDPGGIHDEIKRGKEKELRVKIESPMGTLRIQRCSNPSLIISDMETEKNKRYIPELNYGVNGSTGILDVSVNDNDEEIRSFNFGSDYTWNIQLNDNIPMILRAELGAGKGEFDLTGLRIENFDLSTGASSVMVVFRAPNPIIMDHLKIESGIGRFQTKNLGFANFRTMNFQGGVGSYELDLTGLQQPRTEMFVEQGIGSIKIFVPPDVGIRLEHHGSFLSRLHVGADLQQREDDIYYSTNYESTPKKLMIMVDSGVGSVSVVRR